jgi:transposase
VLFCARLKCRAVADSLEEAGDRLVASTPEAIPATIRASGDDVERVGLEAGINSAWIARGLQEAELPVIVIDATHATAALKTGFATRPTRTTPAALPT